MAEQQVFTRGVRRSAAPTVRLVLPTTRSAATANDLLQNLIIDRSAPQQARPVQQMPARPPAARPAQFAQRNTPQQSPKSLRLEGQGALDQIRNLLILQRGLSQDAPVGDIVNEQGGQAGRDAAGSMMGRTDNDNNAIGRYGPGFARALGNMALSGTLGPFGPAALGVISRNLTNDDPNAVAADATTTGLRTAVTNAVPGLGLARSIMSLFRLPDPVVQVEKVVRPLVKDVLDQLTNPPSLPAAGEGAIGSDPTTNQIGRITNNWGGNSNMSMAPQRDTLGEAIGAPRSRNPAATNMGWRGWLGGDDGSAGNDSAGNDSGGNDSAGNDSGGNDSGGSGRGIGGSGFGGGNGGFTGGLGDV